MFNNHYGQEIMVLDSHLCLLIATNCELLMTRWIINDGHTTVTYQSPIT